LNPVDALWLTADRPENLMVIEALVMLSGDVDRARLEQVMQRRVVERFPVFGQRAAASRRPWGRRRWVDADGFRVAHHIREVALPTPADDAAVQDYVASHLGTPLPHDRPLWEIHLITGHPTGTAMYVRLHHSIADGMALVQVLLSVTDAAHDDPLESSTNTPAAPRVKAARRQGLGGALPAVSKGVAVAVQVPVILIRLLLGRSPSTALSGVATRSKLVAWSEAVPLDDIKRVAKATDSTVNDVLVAALSGALHRYQLHHDGDAVDLPTMIPVNLRPFGEPLEAGLGNRFAVVILRMPSGLQTAAARLTETKRRMDKIKKSPEPLITFALMHGIGRTGRHLSRLLARFFATKAIGVTTNVPGPKEPRYVAGARIDKLMGWVPGTGHQSLGTCIFSYAGNVHVGFKVDAAAIPHPGRIVEAFHDEIQALLEIAPQAAAPPSAPDTIHIDPRLGSHQTV
jgi:diacylglycerol O-acyltransferase / wax synthase